MRRYSVESRTGKYVKEYGFLSFARKYDIGYYCIGYRIQDQMLLKR